MDITDEELVHYETRFIPFGEFREDVGTISETDFGYTYQKIITGSGLTLREGAWTTKLASTLRSAAGSSSQIGLCRSRGGSNYYPRRGLPTYSLNRRRPRGGSNSQPTDSKNRPVESIPYMWGNSVYEVAYMGVKNVQEVHFWH
jgi:hypothetical protein